MGLIKRGKIWYIRYRYAGRDIRQGVGSSKRKAELVLGKIKAEIAEGRFLDTSHGSKISYGALIDRYLKEHSAVRKSAESQREDFYIARELRAQFGQLLLKDIIPDVVSPWIETLNRKGKAASTINHRITFLKHSLTMAKRWNYVRHNPLSDIKRLTEPPGRLVYLKPEELERLIAELPEYQRPIVIMAAHTGMRRGEIFSLTWEQVNLAQRVATLPRTKNQEVRGVPLNLTVVELLRDLMRERARRGYTSPFVFVNPLTADRWRDLGRAFRQAVKRANLEGMRFHDLRHTAASWMVMSGVDLLTVADILGHKDTRMTERYSHLSPAHRLNAVAALDKALSGEKAAGNVAQDVAQPQEERDAADRELIEKIGAGDRGRTGDVQLGKLAFYR